MALNQPNPNGQALSAASAPVVIASDQSPVGIQNELITFKDDFAGSSLLTANWTTTSMSGTTTSMSVANSILTINAGTTANDYTAITSKIPFTTPFRMQANILISQRIANNNFYIELVNSAGTVAATIGSLVANTGVSQVGWLFNGTSTTSNTVVAQNQGVKSTVDSAVSTSATSSYAVFEIEARGDVVDFVVRGSESNAVGTAYASRNRTILTPGENYYLQIRSVNSSTAPASATTISIDNVLVQNVTKTVVEVSGGRGNNSGTKDIPVFVQSANTLPAAIAVNSSSSGMTAYTNATLSNTPVQIKSSSGRIYDIYAYNPNSTTVYLQVFNALSTSVTLGSTAPLVSFPLLAGQIWDKTFFAQYSMGTAITVAVTTTRTGATAPTTGIDINLGYA